MSQLGQQMFFVRKRSNRCFCAKAQRQQHDVGHKGVITGCDGFSLRSTITDPKRVAQSPL
ncbi:hypothetical protein LSPCS325_51450 [Lysinibacillus sp. CTST325]